MKGLNFLKRTRWTKSKIGLVQEVKRSKLTIEKPILEAPMNVPMITTLSVIGIGILALLATRFQKAAARQPILIEKRQIIYRRRP